MLSEKLEYQNLIEISIVNVFDEKREAASCVHIKNTYRNMFDASPNS